MTLSILAFRSAGTEVILWTLEAWAWIFFMRLFFVRAFASNVQSMPMSAHLKLGIPGTTAGMGQERFAPAEVVGGRGASHGAVRRCHEMGTGPRPRSRRGAAQGTCGVVPIPVDMPLDAERERERIAASLRSAARPGTWEKLQAYLGSPVPVLGLTTPQLREAHKAFARGHPALTAAEVNALAAALWRGGTWEEKIFAVGMLDRHRDELDDASWALADSWVDGATGWGLSDGLASGPVSFMVHARPKRFAEILRWTRAENLWRRRASTYALYEFVRAGELGPPFRLLERLLYDEEFWVQRAVGTWLRECWKKDARRTEAFLLAHSPGIPPVTVTVATERSSKAFRAKLRARNRRAKRGRR